MNDSAPTFLRYKEGDDTYTDLTEKIWNASWSHQCPVYVHRAPPCQATCPSGHDIRGWLQIVSGLDKPKDGQSWQEYAFQRMTLSNPFPAVMGRCCPAPCEDGCNRNEIEDHVGINSVEQYVGDWALKNRLSFAKPKKETGKKVAVVGGGPGGISCAYQLRLKGHAPTIFEANEKLGGMMQYGLSSHRCPRDVVDAEVQRIMDLGVEVRSNTVVGVDVTVEQLEKEFDAIFWGIGAQKGRTLNVPGGDAPNCIDGLAYLQAANRGQLKYLSGRVLVIGGGDTALDCASVSRRLGNVPDIDPKDRTENVLQGKTTHKKPPANRAPGDVMIVYRRPMERAPAKVEDIKITIGEGVEWRESSAPVEVVQDKDGRAIALKVVPVDWIDNREMVVRTGEEFDIECSLIVGAVAQSPDMTGLDAVDNGQGWMDADGFYRVQGKPQHFVGGDIINPELLTTAIGHGWKAAEGIDKFVSGEEPAERAQVDAHRFDIYDELRRAKLEPKGYKGGLAEGTDSTDIAVHNYEDRSYRETQTTKGMFLSHFEVEPRHERTLKDIPEDVILDNFEERLQALAEEDIIAEAKRCMSCGLCLECDNCLVYCPQLAVNRVKKDQRAVGRYVETDYSKCIGCHICADVCPTGYIQMGLGSDPTMKHALALIHGLTVALGVLLAGPPAVKADEGRVPLPTLAKAKGDQCVAPVYIMRRDHMELLKTQRDETMRQGIRGNKFSLKGCVDCHATPDPTVKEGQVRNLTAFCDQCHEYAGIRIDCFDCHTDEPAPASSADGSTDRSDGIRLISLLGDYLTGKGRSR